MSDPKRLLDDALGTRGELKDLLHAGKSELPNDTQLLELAAKIGIAGAAGAAAGAGAGAAGAGAGGAGAAKVGAGATAVTATKGALAIKIGVAVAVVSAAGAGTVAVTSKRADVEQMRPSGIVATATTTASSAMGINSVTLPPRIDPLSSASAEPSATATAKLPAKPKAEDEVKLLERAQDALKSRPDEALALCNEHAKSYPNGMLAQEREVIAVQALMKTGRTEEAKARAERFKARYPGSSHTRRIEAIVAP